MSAAMRGGLAALLLLFGAGDAKANWWVARPVAVTPYYHPVYRQPVYAPAMPYYYGVSPVCDVVIPAPRPVQTIAPPLARPTPAPPSSTPPPLAPNSPPKQTGKPPPPTVTEVRTKPGDQTGIKPAPKDPVYVNFWNNGSKDLDLIVDGKKYTLDRNRGLKLQVNRDFTWQVGNQPPRLERVPENRLVHEINLRD